MQASPFSGGMHPEKGLNINKRIFLEKPVLAYPQHSKNDGSTVFFRPDTCQPPSLVPASGHESSKQSISLEKHKKKLLIRNALPQKDPECVCP